MTGEGKQGSASVVVCSLIGWICILIHCAALYNGGESHSGFILRSLGSGNLGNALGSLLGGGLPAIIALVMAVIIRKHGAGAALMAVSCITLLMTLFVM